VPAEPAQEPAAERAAEPAASEPAAAAVTAEDTPASPGAAAEPSGNGTDPGNGTGPPEVLYTPAGLPWRVRQASIARPPTASRPDASADGWTGPAEPPGRSPEEIRRMMTSYQSGGQRGRAESTNPQQEAPQEAPDDRGVVEGG
jgi:hypothetical protein